MKKKVSKGLYQIIYEAQNGSNKAVEKILFIFEPLIGKYTSWLKDEDAKQNLILFIIELLVKYPIKSFQSDAAFVQYISHSICHEYIRLSKYQQELRSKCMLLKDDFYSYQDPGERIDYQITICSFLYQLPSEQKEILVLKYYYGYIEQEIGDKMHISRQAVNKQKNQALKKLKLFIIS